MTTTTTYRVTGMTCAHCVGAVTGELQALRGVVGVHIDLRPERDSQVNVTSDAPLDRTAVAEAVTEAGYELCTD